MLLVTTFCYTDGGFVVRIIVISVSGCALNSVSHVGQLQYWVEKQNITFKILLNNNMPILAP